MSAQDTLIRAALRYHLMDDRKSTSGSMATDMHLIIEGLVTIGKDSRLHVTGKGRAFLAPTTEPKRSISHD